MDIDYKLKLWGAWAGEVLGLQIKPLAMFKNGECLTPDTMSDDEAQTFDPAVAALKTLYPDLYEIIRLHYIHRLSYNAIARVKHKNVRNIFEGCLQAQSFIEGYLTGFSIANGEIALSSLQQKV
ncbi:hypothetical protein SB5439_05004 [Klebsiella variicola]|uniref:antiterminator Q family protein n=1 Tax=Klebsiella variicola TaxID=244366 RepID=UPI0010E0D896|nr:antiterminator Q family protein [Klebsiella variicola]VGQ11856.1 hypothetical protein SB5439_05004 [Klebsiella variicola]